MANEKRLISDCEARRRIIAFATGLHSEVLPVDTVMMLLTQIPTVDAVEVVRCKDCKSFKFYKKTSLLVNGQNVPAGWCMKWAKDDSEHKALPGDFCSYGERRSDGL